MKKVSWIISAFLMAVTVAPAFSFAAECLPTAYTCPDGQESYALPLSECPSYGFGCRPKGTKAPVVQTTTVQKRTATSSVQQTAKTAAKKPAVKPVAKPTVNKSKVSAPVAPKKPATAAVVKAETANPNAALIAALMAKLKELQSRLAELLTNNIAIATNSSTSPVIITAQMIVATPTSTAVVPMETTTSSIITTTPMLPKYALCSFNGQSILHGSSVLAYQAAAVPYGSTCTSQNRLCSNGNLSGSYIYTSCAVGSSPTATCTPDASSPQTRTQSCQSGYTGGVTQQRTSSCTSGATSPVWSAWATTINTCFVPTPPIAQSCTFNGLTIASGASVTAYQAPSVAYGSTCVSQNRTCSNGVLSGSYTFASCTVGSALMPTCTPDASSPQTRTISCPSGQTGSITQTRTSSCASGATAPTWSAWAPTANTCVNPPAAQSCTFNNQTVASGASVTAYRSALVAPGAGAACVEETRTCSNGTLSGSYPASSCSVNAWSKAMRVRSNNQNGTLQYYSLAPSVVRIGSVDHMFVCSQDTPGDMDDQIIYQQFDASTGVALTTERVVLAPEIGSGLWSQYHICDPSVIAVKSHMNGQDFNYAMFFNGNAENTAMANQIGVALAKDITGPWVKYPYPLLYFTEVPMASDVLHINYSGALSSGHWGVGQPTATSVDDHQFLLAYTVGDNNPREEVRTISLNDIDARGIKISDPRTVSLVNGNQLYGTLMDVDMAYDSQNDRMIMVNTHWLPWDTVTGAKAEPSYIPQALEAFSIPGGNVWSNTSAVWQKLGILDATSDGAGFRRHFSGGIVRNIYGGISDPKKLELYWTSSCTFEYDTGYTHTCPHTTNAFLGNDRAEWTYDIWESTLPL